MHGRQREPRLSQAAWHEESDALGPQGPQTEDHAGLEKV